MPNLNEQTELPADLRPTESVDARLERRYVEKIEAAEAARRQHGSAAQAVAYARYRSTFGNGATLHWCDRKDEGAFPLFAAPPVADAEGVKADLIEGLKLLLEGRGCGFRGQFADDAYSEAADALIDRIAALSRLNGEKK